MYGNGRPVSEKSAISFDNNGGSSLETPDSCGAVSCDTTLRIPYALEDLSTG
jgi:hypothetical protein